MAPALGIRIGPAWRVVGETETIDTLLAEGWAPDAVRRDRPRAEREAHVVLERLIGLGLGVSVREGRRFFDPAEMINFALWASQQHGDPFWSKVSVPNARHFVWRAHRLAPREHGPPPAPSTLPPRRFTVRLARRVALEGLAPGTPVRLRLPRPIEGPALRDLELTMAPIEDATARVSSAEGRIDVRLSAPASLSVELGYEASFLAAPASVAPEAPLSEAERARYLRASEGLVRVTRPIAELAARIAGEEADPWAQVVRFWRFLLETTLGGAVDYDEIDLARPQEWTIENRWTDCQMASALLVALSRARAIPARLLRGYVLDEQGPYYHCWCEVWIAGRGWTPLDSVAWYFSDAGRDADWRDHYLGQLDYRMTTEQLPRLFAGLGEVRVPRGWARLSRIEDDGLTQSFHDRASGALIYSDRLSVLSRS